MDKNEHLLLQKNDVKHSPQASQASQACIFPKIHFDPSIELQFHSPPTIKDPAF